MGVTFDVKGSTFKLGARLFIKDWDSFRQNFDCI